MVWILFGLALLIGLTLAVSWYSYRIAFYNANIQSEQDAYSVPEGEQYHTQADKMLSYVREVDYAPYEQVYITSHDGLRLAARYHHVKDGAPVQIQFHGFHGSSLRDMCGCNELARRSGYNTILVDQRAHGKSEGHTISFGIEERYDCLKWIDYAIDRFGKDAKIVLCGLSMGAATVLMASGLELPKNVVGIIADCPYSGPGAIIRKVCGMIHIPGWLAYPFIVLGAWFFGGINITADGPVKAVKRATVPILLLHGEDDRFVPCSMSREIYAACASPRTLVTIPEAGHGLSYLVDPETYESAVADFLKSIGL